MGKKKWYVILFYVVFILIYGLVLSVPLGMVVRADDSAPADASTEELTEEAPPEEPPPENPPPVEPVGDPVSSEPVYSLPEVVVPPPVVIEQPVVTAEQPPVTEAPAVSADQPPATDEPPASEQPAAETAQQSETPGQPVVSGEGVAEPVVTSPEVTTASVPEGVTLVAAPPTGSETEPPAVTDTGQTPVDAGLPAVPVDVVPAEPLTEPVEMLEALPEGANLVVLDDTGEALPLASGEAAETLVNGDPMYCSGTDAPGSGSCISYGTIEAAINHAKLSGNGNCTIYVEVGYSSPSNNTITINGSDFDSNSNINLFGGYDLVSNTVVGQTPLVQNFLISNITGSLTLANFLIQEFSTPGNTIEVNNSEDVTLKNMDINNSGGGNAVRVNHSEDVTVQNSKIQEKGNGFGVYVHRSDGVQILNTTIREYGNDGGVYLEHANGVLLDKVAIQSHDPGCVGVGCSTDAIRVVNGSQYTLRDVNATSEFGSGLSTDSGVSDYIRIFDSEFDDNGQRGVSIFSGEAISISNTSIRDNGGDYGLIVQSGSIDLQNVHVDSNDYAGAYLFANGWINIQTSTFSGNHHNYGLYASSANQYIKVNGSSADGNHEYGANLSADTYINVLNSHFNANGFYGLMTRAPDAITLFNVTGSGNEDDGVVLKSSGTITVSCSVFSNNQEDGLESTMTGPHATLTLNSVTIEGNGLATDISGGSVFENLSYPCGGSSSSDDGGDDTETTTTTAAVPAGVVYIIGPGDHRGNPGHRWCVC